MDLQSTSNGIEIIRPNLHNVAFTLFKDYNHEQRLYDGIEIAAYGTYTEVRMMDIFKAALISPNEIVVQIPAINAMFHFHFNVWLDRVPEASPFHCERLIQAHKAAYFKIKNNPHLQVRILVFDFGQLVTLSNSINSPDTIDGVMVAHRVAMSEAVTTAAGNNEFEQHQVRVAWKVHIHQDNPRQVEDEEDTFEDLDDMIAGMRINR